jgi:hypothetical protein
MPLFIIPAVKTSAWYSSMLPNFAFVGSSIQMNVVTVFTMGDQIGPAKLPAYYSFFNVLF